MVDWFVIIILYYIVPDLHVASFPLLLFFPSLSLFPLYLYEVLCVPVPALQSVFQSPARDLSARCTPQRGSHPQQQKGNSHPQPEGVWGEGMDSI